MYVCAYVIIIYIDIRIYIYTHTRPAESHSTIFSQLRIHTHNSSALHFCIYNIHQYSKSQPVGLLQSRTVSFSSGSVTTTEEFGEFLVLLLGLLLLLLRVLGQPLRMSHTFHKYFGGLSLFPRHNSQLVVRPLAFAQRKAQLGRRRLNRISTERLWAFSFLQGHPATCLCTSLWF